MNAAPLISICFTCYNQRRYVELALKSVLRQTYSNLEVIVCDDCSTDGTSEIVEKVVQEYRQTHQGCAHPVIISRAAQNGGIISNLVRGFSLAKGELIVQAHDDDISMPTRVQRIVDAWLAANKEPTMILHGWSVIDHAGHVIGGQEPWGGVEPWTSIRRSREWLKGVWPHGAVSAYVPDVVLKFPSIVVNEAFEDVVLTYRAKMLGNPLLLSDRLIAYRVGSGCTTSLGGGLRSSQIRKGLRGAAAQKQAYLDLEFCKGKFMQKWLEEVKFCVDTQTEEFVKVKDLFSAQGFREKWICLRNTANMMLANQPRRRWVEPILLLPNMIGDCALAALSFLWYWRQRLRFRNGSIKCDVAV